MTSVKNFFMMLYNIKYYVAIAILAFFIFLRLYFPDELVIKLVMDNIYQQTGLFVEPVSPSISFFPSVGISFESAKLKLQNREEKIVLGPSKVKISLLSILMFAPTARFSTESFEGRVSGKISGLPVNPSGKPDELGIDIEGEGIQLYKIIKNFIPVDIHAKSDFKVRGAVNAVNYAYSDLQIDVTLSNIVVSEGNVMGMTFPGMGLKSGNFSGSFVKSELLVSRLSMGGKSDDLDLSMSGKMVMKFNNPYDFTVSLKIGGNLEQQFGQFLSFGPLTKARKPDGYYRFKLKGDFRTPIPAITPL
ncbi:MAG: type II secretion system protein GspN [Oligoflexia bacterium]|nr:type II secretion system protein GspN [Oligoflexia bacterium]